MKCLFKAPILTKQSANPFVWSAISSITNKCGKLITLQKRQNLISLGSFTPHSNKATGRALRALVFFARFCCWFWNSAASSRCSHRRHEPQPADRGENLRGVRGGGRPAVRASAVGVVRRPVGGAAAPVHAGDHVRGGSRGPPVADDAQRQAHRLPLHGEPAAAVVHHHLVRPPLHRQ